MADPCVFVSFDLESDQAIHTAFVEESKQAAVHFLVEDASTRLALPTSEAGKFIRGRIGRADILVVLVGQHGATCANIRGEIEMAKNTNVPFFGVYADGTGAQSALPIGLPRNRTIPWNWQDIGGAIQQLMHEGKHYTFV